MTKLTVLDLYCGAGGFSEGFRQQGFRIIDGIDCWRPAVDSFNFNFGLECALRNTLDFETSIEQIEALPDTDVIIGSPPCVSFSSSNRSGKADKTLGLRLTKAFLKVVAVKKHKRGSHLKAWVMENVTNSASHLPDYFTFEDLGLTDWACHAGLRPDATAIELKSNRTEINSADFGVPQTRTRLFTAEFTRTEQPLVPSPTHAATVDLNGLPTYVTLGYVLESLPSPNSPETEDFLADPLYPGVRIARKQLTDYFYDTGLYACEWKESRYLKTNHPYMGRMSFPEKTDRPSRTIIATKIGNSREAIIYRSERLRQGDGEYRTPTVREAATLMGFPITFQFLGSEGNKWKLVGNAVCPPVSRAFAKEIRQQLGAPGIDCPRVSSISPRLDIVSNLNTFSEKGFDTPPQRKKGARFRRHPFKNGNMTVTLSNYDISTAGHSETKWRTSIQYGTGEGFSLQNFPDGAFSKLVPIISEFKGGPHFIHLMNNGFAAKIAPARVLQRMFETHINEHDYVEPTELVDQVRDLIDGIQKTDSYFNQDGQSVFKKQRVPWKQVMALYALNRICSVANGGNK